MLEIRTLKLELNSIGEWPLYLRILIVILCIVLIAVYLWNFRGDDMIAKINKQKATMQNINSNIMLLKEKLASKVNNAGSPENTNIEENNKDLQSVKNITDAINMLIPDKMLINNYIEQISILAFKTKLKIIALKIRKEKVLDRIVSLPIELTLLGKYNDINTFLHGLGLAHRFTLVKSFTITKFNENNAELLKIRIVVNIYFCL